MIKKENQKLSLKYFCDNECNNYKCCTQTGPAILLDEELEKIRKYTKENDLPNIDDYIEKTEFEGFYLLIRSENGCFYFMDGNCLIQEVKPIDCLVYPLGFGNEGKLAVDFNHGCPAINHLDNNYFENVKNIIKKIPEEIKNQIGIINRKIGYNFISNEQLEEKLK